MYHRGDGYDLPLSHNNYIKIYNGLNKLEIRECDGTVNHLNINFNIYHNNMHHDESVLEIKLTLTHNDIIDYITPDNLKKYFKEIVLHYLRQHHIDEINRLKCELSMMI